VIEAEVAMTIPTVKAFFDTRTSSVQYVVSCPHTLECAVIDPVFDFEEKSGATAKRFLKFPLDALEGAVWD
jgi:glyoxylase-like metal-dependent hydrolase (beta-lactamase superfamily II)